MTQRKGKVVPFYRGARGRSQRKHGDVPNPRGRKPYRPVKRHIWRWVISAGVCAVVLGPTAMDAVSLTWRNSEGCKIWKVVDGDTVRMSCPQSGSVTGRIVGFDTPELKAGCPKELGIALAATFYLRWQLWTARDVVATPRGQDRYGRTLTLMSVDGELIGSRMVNAGLARWYDGGRRVGWCGSAE